MRAVVPWVACLAMASGVSCRRSTQQPISFNHRLHADNNVSCAVCHPTAATGHGATLPDVSLCRRCHEDVLYESAEEAKIRLAAERGRPIRWRPVTALRPYVYFSHLRHVRLGKIPCAVCHGEVELRTAPFEAGMAPFSGSRGMDLCIRCHEESHSRHAGTDCIVCHR